MFLLVEKQLVYVVTNLTYLISRRKRYALYPLQYNFNFRKHTNQLLNNRSNHTFLIWLKPEIFLILLSYNFFHILQETSVYEITENNH